MEGLPDCMALEMVSPPRKFSQAAEQASVSLDGERVIFLSKAALVDPPGQSSLFTGERYVATRGEDGWTVESTAPLPQPVGDLLLGWHNNLSRVRSFSPDFSRWLTLAAAPNQFELGVAQAFRGGVGGVFSPLSPLLVPVDGHATVLHAIFAGASEDHSRLYFTAGIFDGPRRPEDLSVTYLAGDPSPGGVGAERNTYVAGTIAGGAPELELLARDGDGKVWGGRCGARLGGVVPSGSGTNGRYQGAVSADGSRVFFMTRPGQEGSGACDTATNKLRVMRRVETGAGPWISPLYGSECDRVAPACSGVDGDDLFQGASADGSRVYFTTTRQLADSDLDEGVAGLACGTLFASPGCDLYLYDSTRPVGERLVQVSAGDADSPTPGAGAGVLDGIAAISGDGSHVYFVAEGVLTNDTAPNGTTATAGQPNLYLYQRDADHPDGRLAFLGTAAASDRGRLWGAPGVPNRAYPVPVKGDGHVLVFASSAPFTSDDVDGGRRDIFRYDSASDELVRVSKGVPGGSDNGPFDVYEPLNVVDGSVAGTAFAEFKRWASEDGRTIVFKTPEGLAADDDNGLFDDYLWRDGQLHRLPGTSSREDGLHSSLVSDPTPALSHDGSTVAFESRMALLAQDRDLAVDVYVARVGGGFLEPAEPVICAILAGECQQAGVGALGTESRTASGGGDFEAGERRRVSVRGLSARARRRAARTGIVAVGVTTNRAGRIVATARARIGKRWRLVGRSATTLARPGAAKLRIRLHRAARKRLRATGKLVMTVRVSATGARSRSINVVLRRAGR